MTTEQPRFDRSKARARLLKVALATAQEETKKKCPSRALRLGQYPKEETRQRGAIIYPHYWSYFLHEGRGPVYARTAPTIVYYKNPRLDPRIAVVPFNYPVRVRDRRRLTPSEFKRDRAANRLIIAQSTGPAKKQPWLTEDMKGAPEARIVQATRRELDRIVKQSFPKRVCRVPISFA